MFYMKILMTNKVRMDNIFLKNFPSLILYFIVNGELIWRWRNGQETEKVQSCLLNDITVVAPAILGFITGEGSDKQTVVSNDVSQTE